MASGPRLRPTFEVVCEGTPSGVAQRLREGIATRGGGVESRWAGHHLILSPERSSRRWWSPWLHVDVRTAEEMERDPSAGAVVVWCRFSPHPGLWTGFMLTMIALLTVALFALALALAQMTLEWPQWGWWVLVGSAVVAGAMVMGSLTAQRLAGGQMGELRGVVENVLGE